MTANDNDLLREYVRGRSEAAFAELVGRHVRLVYSAALRQMNGDSAAAEDVAQAVFTDLARKAPRLLKHTSLTGWLYTSTRFEAARTRRAAWRRCLHEHAAHAMNEILRNDSPDIDWDTLRPLLDEAMEELSAADREALLWRYFEQQPFADIGHRLGLKENAARMKVERALDKLRAALARRGITSTGVALAAALTAHAMEAVPAGLAERLSRASMAAGAADGLNWFFASAKAKVLAGVTGLLVVAGIVLSLRRSGSANSHDSTPGQEASLPAIQQTTLSNSAVGARPSMEAANSSPLDQPKPLEFRLSLAAQDSRPIVNGEVSCSLETASDSESRKLLSDQRGMIVIPISSNVVGLRLVTKIDGFADTRLAWRQDRGETIPHDYCLRLTPGVSLGGSVVGAQDSPLDGAEVEAYLEEPTTSPRPECHVAGFHTSTDNAGRWRVCRVAPELVRSLHLSARHPDLATGAWLHVGDDPEAEEQLRAGAYVFHLGDTTTVYGMVLDPEGSPVSGAPVRVGGLYEVGTRTCRTAPDGWFSFTGCKVGMLALTGEADGFAPTTARIDPGTNHAPVRLVLSRGSSLNVRVVDRGDNPLANASVHVGPDLFTPGPDGALAVQSFRRGGETDRNGWVSFRSLPDGRLSVGVSARGFICQNGIAAQAGGAELVVSLFTNLVVSGTVRDSVSGKPIPKFRIRTGKPEPAGGAYFSDMDRFVLNFAGGEFRHAYDEGVTMGENPGYMLRFEADGYAAFVSRLIAPDEGSAHLEVSLHPISLRRLSLLNPDGSAASWTDVGLLDRAKGNCLGLTPGGLEHYERTDGALQQTDGQGTIALPADGEIHWLVAANRAGYLEDNLDGVPDGGRLQLQPWGRIEGSLPEAEQHRPGQDVWIEFVRLPQGALMMGMSFHANPDEAGQFILPRVPPGRIHVFVGTKTAVSESQWTWGASVTAEVEVRPGETARPVFDRRVSR